MTQVLPYLFFLSCPASMAVMMWFMMRGTRGDHTDERSDAVLRIAQLEHVVEALRAQPKRDMVETR